MTTILEKNIFNSNAGWHSLSSVVQILVYNIRQCYCYKPVSNFYACGSHEWGIFFEGLSNGVCLSVWLPVTFNPDKVIFIFGVHNPWVKVLEWDISLTHLMTLTLWPTGDMVCHIHIFFHCISDEVTASRALELVHGYEFKGKPVIIQYGKKKSSSTWESCTLILFKR